MKIAKLKSILLLGTLLTLNASAAWAATCSVPSASYPTIQSAVDDPTCTTINVAPGIYPENVSITRSLTLNGAQAGQPVAGRVSGGPAESTVVGPNPAGSPVFLIDAANVTIDGFTIKNTVSTNTATGIQITASGNDAVVFNNIIDGISTLGVGPGGTAQAILLDNGPDNVNISNNDIRNVTANSSAAGILFGGSGTDQASFVFIKGNSISGITSVTSGAYAVRIVSPAFSLDLFENEISNLNGGGWVYAVSFENEAELSQVLDNNFTNLNSPTGNVVAVWLDNPVYHRIGIAFNDFNLPASAYGVAVSPVTIANAIDNNPVGATCNWWGSPDGPGPVGPGHGARVTPLVLYAPWRIAPKPDRTCTGNNVPPTADQCKNGGWTTSVRPDGRPFKNQGDCIQFVLTGR
jgi:hypothetical protein